MSVDWDWTRVVIDHVHIRVQDAAASVAFYKAVLEPLGIPAVWEAERGAQFANLVVTDDEPRTSGPVCWNPFSIVRRSRGSSASGGAPAAFMSSPATSRAGSPS